MGRPAVAESITVRVARHNSPSALAVAPEDSDSAVHGSLLARMTGLVVCAGARIELGGEDDELELEVVATSPLSARFVRVLPCTRLQLTKRNGNQGPPQSVDSRDVQPRTAAARALAPTDEAGPVHAGHRTGHRAQPGVHVLARVLSVCEQCRAYATGSATGGGLRPPARGLLLHGPPGVGKTHIVRTLVAEYALLLVSIDAAPLDLDESAQCEGLRKAFAGARRDARRELGLASSSGAVARVPVLLFADELDALCDLPPRESARDQSAALSEVCACLCMLLEGLPQLGASQAWPAALHAQGGSRTAPHDAGHVLFIGATNRLHAIPPLLLRTGRIECVLPVALGTANEREAVLNAIFAKTPLAADVSLRDVSARLCLGFSQADCAALLRTSAMLALRRSLPQEAEAAEEAAEANHSAGESRIGEGGWRPAVQICMADLERARTQIRPTILRAVELAAEQTRWEDVGGQHDAKLRLRRAVEWPLTHAAALRRLGVRAARGVLMHGPPGCSKTLLVKAVAANLGCTFIHLSGASVYSPFVGEAEATIRAVFRTAAACAPAVLFLDELDALVGSRGESAGSSVADTVQSRVLSTLLTELDGFEDAGQVVLVGATNRIDMIDSALLRPGRLDELIEVTLPGAKDRAAVLRVHTARTPLDVDVDLDALGAQALGLSAADLAQVCVLAALCALRRAHPAGSLATVLVSSADFELAIASTRPSAEPLIRVSG